MGEIVRNLLKETRDALVASISKFEEPLLPVVCCPSGPSFDDKSRAYIVCNENGIAWRRSFSYKDRDTNRIGPLGGQILVSIREEMDVRSNVMMVFCTDFHDNRGWIPKILKGTNEPLLAECTRKRYRVVAENGICWRQRCEYESRVTCSPGPCYNTEFLALCERTDRRSGVQMVYGRHDGQQGWLPVTRRATRRKILVVVTLSSSSSSSSSSVTDDTTIFLTTKSLSIISSRLNDVLETFLDSESKRMYARLEGFKRQIESLKQQSITFLRPSFSQQQQQQQQHIISNISLHAQVLRSKREEDEASFLAQALRNRNELIQKAINNFETRNRVSSREIRERDLRNFEHTYRLEHRREASRELQRKKAILCEMMSSRIDRLGLEHSKVLETVTRQYLERCESEECIETEILEGKLFEKQSRENLVRRNERMYAERCNYESELNVLKRNAELELESALKELRFRHEFDLRAGKQFGEQMGSNRKSKMIHTIETHLERVMENHRDQVDNEMDIIRSSRARLRREMRNHRFKALDEVKSSLSSYETERLRELREIHESSLSEALEKHRSILLRTQSPSTVPTPATPPHLFLSFSDDDEDDDEEEMEEEEHRSVLGCVDVGTKNGRRDLRRRLMIRNDQGQEMFTPLYVHVGERIVYTIEVNEHSSVAWLLSEIIRMQIETHGESRFHENMKPLSGILIYRTKRALDLGDDLISCLGHYNELEAV